jgi:HSP20 family protein
MVVERYDPFRNAVTLRSMMDRLFDESFLRPFRSFPPEGTLPLDVSEKDDTYTITASLPGVKPEDLEITAQGSTLTIKGETKTEEEKKEKDYVVKERREGEFSRTFTLATPIDADKATAKFEHGVLTLTVPKAETAKPKQIALKS